MMGCCSAGPGSGELPERGICAHRGDMNTHPENTLSAFREAVRLGAHMIELDVRLTKDSMLVILHDETVDRTTNGTGRLSDLTLEQVKALDAGSWKSEKFTGERIPAFREALSVMPDNIWLNVHLKGGKQLGKRVARVIQEEKREHQAFLACSREAALGAQDVIPDIMICNMDRQGDRDTYIQQTTGYESEFIQLLGSRSVRQLEADVAVLDQHHIRINFCCSDSPEEVRELLNGGVDFVLTNRLEEMLGVAASMGITPMHYKGK